MAQPSLADRFVKGAAWLTVTQVIAKFTAILRLFVIARLVPQGDVGLFLLAMTVAQWIEVLGYTGICQALIQRPGDVRPYGGTVFVSQAVRGFILGGILIFCGPWIEAYFDKPGLREVLIPMSLMSILGGLRNVGFLFLEREMKFAIPASIDLIRAIVDLLVSIVVALCWPTVWALVIGQISTYFVSTALSYLIIQDRVGPSFRWSYFLSLSRFGFWVVISVILAYGMVSGGQLAVAKMWRVEDLAIYSVAYQLGCTPTAELSRVITRVSFSAFSSMQANHNRAIDAYQQVFAVTSFWVMLVIGLATLAGPGVVSVFRPEYASVTSLLPWLALWGASRALADVDGTLLQALGQPSTASIVQVGTFVAMFATIIPLCRYYGIQGVAWGLGGVAIASQLLRAVVLTWALGMSARNAAMGLLLPSVAALLAGLPSAYIARQCFTAATLVQAVIVSVLFGTIYLLVWLSMDRIFGTMYAIRLRRLLRLG